MSVFKHASLIDRMETKIDDLSAENKKISTRFLNMTKMMSRNRVAAKKIVEERDEQITRLKEMYNKITVEYGDIVIGLNTKIDKITEELNDKSSEIYNLKEMVNGMDDDIVSLNKQLEDQCSLNEKLINEAYDNSTIQSFKIGELQTKIEMITEVSNDQVGRIYELEKIISEKDAELAKKNEMVCSLYDQVTSYEGTNKRMKAELDHANEMINALKHASSYMNEVLSHKM